MKKFISALSSFVIAATALGGSLAMSTTAATNGSVSETIIDIQSNGKNKIEGAKAGDKIPFKVYVPQSSGLNSMGLKLTVNGDATRGQDPSKCGGATEYTLTKDSKLGAKGEKITHPEIFGNYGITISNAKMSDPMAFDSKSLKPADWWKAGMPSALGSATFNAEQWVISAVATGAINAQKNIDSFAAAEAAGLDREADEEWDYKPFYQGFTPVTTWTSDESWAYKYSIAEGTLVLPSDLPDGTYVVDVFKGEYVSALFLENFYVVKDGQTVDDPYNGNTVYTETQIEGVSGIQKYSTKPLTVVVGEGGGDETDPPETTTTTSSSSKTDPTDGIVLDLVAANKTNTFDGTNNVVEVAAGETVKVNYTVKNDSVTSGMEFTFDLGKATYVADTFAAGRAYSFNTELNDGVAGQLTFTMAANETATARDGATIVTFSVKAPASGSTTIGLKSGARAIVAGYDKGVSNPYTFHGLTLKVTDSGDTTTTTTETTQPSGDEIVLDLVAANKTNTFDGKNNVAEVAPGETVKVNYTVKNDSITSGMEFTFDLGKATYVADTFAAGRAYSFNTELNDGVAGQLTFTMAANETATARDGATIVTFTVTAPQSGTATIGLKSGARAIVAGYEKGVSNPYVFHGLTLKVVEQNDTTTTTTETTETTQPSGDVLWGDTNCDKQVTIADVVLLNKSLAKNATLTAQGKKNADCQFDNSIDTKDAACIKGYLAMVIDYKVLGNANAYETLQSFYNAETGNYEK